MTRRLAGKNIRTGLIVSAICMFMFGITLTLVGITTFIVLTIAGGILTIACGVRWIKQTRADIDELPLE